MFVSIINQINTVLSLSVRITQRICTANGAVTAEHDGFIIHTCAKLAGIVWRSWKQNAAFVAQWMGYSNIMITQRYMHRMKVEPAVLTGMTLTEKKP